MKIKTLLFKEPLLHFCTYFKMTSATNWLRTCACSLGGPGRKRDEQRGGRSTLGTGHKNHNMKNHFVKMSKCVTNTDHYKGVQILESLLL